MKLSKFVEEYLPEIKLNDAQEKIMKLVDEMRARGGKTTLINIMHLADQYEGCSKAHVREIAKREYGLRFLLEND